MSRAETQRGPHGDRKDDEDGRSDERRAHERGAPRNRQTLRRGKAASEIDLGPLDNYIGFHLRLAQEIALRAFIRKTGKADFRPGWFAVLMVIRLNPGISQSALSRAIGRDKSTLSPLIRELQAKSLIMRRPAAGDRRSVTLSLTKAGESELDALLQHVETHDRRMDEIVGEDKAMLIALLRKISVAFA
jgi:DNA-binding MarR family transcriptional regulator